MIHGEPVVATVVGLSGGIWEILRQNSFFGLLIISVLIIMSLVSWGIIINRYRLYKEVNLQSRKFGALFTRSAQTTDLMNNVRNFHLSPLAAIYAAGIKETEAVLEAKAARNNGDAEGVLALDEGDFRTVNLMMDKTAAEEVGKLERYVVFLATTANAAPFLGLLGTVVGIMNSFWSIGERGSASLVIVAPGIAEALLATIVGLAAAIPAVIAYNWANNKLKYITDQANNFSLELLARLKKDSYR